MKRLILNCFGYYIKLNGWYSEVHVCLPAQNKEILCFLCFFLFCAGRHACTRLYIHLTRLPLSRKHLKLLLLKFPAKAARLPNFRINQIQILNLGFFNKKFQFLLKNVNWNYYLNTVLDLYNQKL